MPSREERVWHYYERDKTLRKARKQIKRNRKPKKVRRKNWMEYAVGDSEGFDARDDDAFLGRGRIMPRGEQERRRAILSTALTTQEREEESEGTLPGNEIPGRQGIVVEVSSGLCRVDLDAETLLCGLRGSLSVYDTGFTNVVAVGDQVIVSADGADRGMVELVMPRRSALVRPDVFHNHLQQAIVANVDQMLIVAAWRDPHIWLELIDRYLIAAERNNLSPVICVNKIDLAENVAEYHATLQPYVELGYRVLFTSAQSGEGIDELRSVLRRRTTVLAGLSGVGKSSLLMLAQPGLQLRAAPVSSYSGEGRHTTTQVSLLRLDDGGFVVDTPGIREFGLSGLRRGDLTRFYPEILRLESSCQFSDCSHTHEPGCTVLRGLDQGHVSRDRYHNYRKIHDSLPA